MLWWVGDVTVIRGDDGMVKVPLVSIHFVGVGIVLLGQRDGCVSSGIQLYSLYARSSFNPLHIAIINFCNVVLVFLGLPKGEASHSIPLVSARSGYGYLVISSLFRARKSQHFLVLRPSSRCSPKTLQPSLDR